MNISLAHLTRILITFFFSITLLELFLCGGGRVLEFGPLTFRIILFIFNLLIVILLWIQTGKTPSICLILSVIVTLVFIIYSFIGWFDGAPFSLILEDIKPLSYFYSIFFFSFFIDSNSRIRLLISLLRKSSLLMASAYIIIQILLYFNVIVFTEFYQFVNTKVSSSDFMFRGNQGLFSYKGFVYMIIGLIFWIHSDKTKRKNIAILIISMAMILSGTRGFVVMFFLVYAMFYGIPLILKLNLKVLFLAVIMFVTCIYFFANFDLGNKIQSDSKRIEQVNQVVERVNLKSLFIGHGFGVGIPVRKIHMEIGYLEVFHKQGVVGLFLWGILLTYIYNQYKKRSNSIKTRKAFFISVIFVFLLSITNPYFNNPIGISFIIITISTYAVLNKSQKFI